MLVGDAELDGPPNAIRIEPHCIDVLSEATTSAESLRSRALSLYANAWAAALPDNVQAAIKEFRAGMHLLGLERDLAYWDNDWVACAFTRLVILAALSHCLSTMARSVVFPTNAFLASLAFMR